MISCHICDSEQLSLSHKIDGYKYYFCEKCHSLMLTPIPSTQIIKKLYKKVFKYEAGRNNELIIRRRANNIIKKLTKMNPTGKQLLDIGSGLGFFLDELKKTNVRGIGIEPSEQLSKYSTDHYKLNIFHGSLQDFIKIKKKIKYDFITLIHVIEHIDNPKLFLSNIINLLNPGGILFIETPNLDSYLYKFEKDSYTFLTPPDHIYIFSSLSFKYLLPQSNNIVYKISTYSYSEHFMGILKSIFKKPEQTKNIKLDDQIINKNPNQINIYRKLKFIFFDKFIAQIFFRMLNIHNKGSILELYVKKK